MKKADIAPGMPVACASSYYGVTTTHVRQGQKCVPGVVVGVGRFRIRQVGLCGNLEAVEDPHTGIMAVVLMQDYNHDALDRKAAWEVTSETTWTLRAVSTQAIVPMPYFEHVRDERLALFAEMQATQERLSEVQKQMNRLGRKYCSRMIEDGTLKDHIIQRMDSMNGGFGNYQNDGPDGGRYYISFSANFEIRQLPLTDDERAEFDKLKKEADHLAGLLACQRRS